jgi:hypothetical protein
MADSNYIYRRGLAPNTSSVISSKVKVYAVPANGEDPTQIGVVASFDPTESRSIEPIRGIGYGDQIAELVPGNTEPMSLSVNRSAQYLSNIYQAFGYKGGVDGVVRSLKYHRWPFDIVKEVVFSEMVDNDADTAYAGDVQKDIAASPYDDSLRALLTTYEACWFSDWGTSFSSDTAIVQENCTIMVSDVHDGINYTETMTAKEDTGNTESSLRVRNFVPGGATVNAAGA